MKKLLLGLVLLMALTGCQQNNQVTTYKEVIKDGQVEIDEIIYDIKSESKVDLTYDDNTIL